MTNVGIDVIKKLREVTGSGLSDCKEALSASSGDLEEAKRYLREKGLSKASGRSHRDATDGLIAVHVAGSSGAILQLHSETDFVSRNEKFRNLATCLVKELHGYKSEDCEGFLQSACGQVSVREEIMSVAAVIGENVRLGGMGYLELGASGVIGSYIHGVVGDSLGRAAALVALESNADSAKLTELAKQLAMHIVAARPESISIEALSEESVRRERAVVEKQVSVLGKPEMVAKKIIDGRMQKFFEDIVLLEQIFVVDGQTRIRDLILAKERDFGCSVVIRGYKLFFIG